MRRKATALLGLAYALALPAIASAQTHNSLAGGFGGLTFGTSATASTFGGSIALGLTDNFQIVGEAGRLGDVKPSIVDSVLDLTPMDMRVSAFYGEGGVRFIASPRSAIRPYAEATAGMARLSSSFNGLGRTGPFVDAALAFFNRTEPLLGVGAGVMLQGGPVLVDLGYRYKKIVAGDSLQALVNGGRDFEVSQVRVGFGVRF
jgi:opacity protein-like surface antigen